MEGFQVHGSMTYLYLISIKDFGENKRLTGDNLRQDVITKVFTNKKISICLFTGVRAKKAEACQISIFYVPRLLDGKGFF